MPHNIKEDPDDYLKKTFEKRVIIILVAFMIGAVIIIGRLFYFQVLHHKEFLAKSQAQQRKAIDLNANRGSIFDRNNALYATSIDAFSLYANPRTATLSATEIAQLAEVIHQPAAKIASQLSSRYAFVWVKRKMSKTEENAFRNLRLEGVYFGFDKHKDPFVYVNPTEVRDKAHYARYLADTLHIDYDKLLANLKKYSELFVVKKKVTDEELRAIMRQTYYGFDLIREDKRIYLKGTEAADVLGYVGMDNVGFGGIELFFDKDMKGAPGKFMVEYDRKGNEIYTHTKEQVMPENGKNIYLTLDSYIQYVSEKAIQKAVIDFQADRGMVVAMDPTTGEILALAAFPNFDPNNFYKSNKNLLTNDLISLVYEPGSTFKVLTIASALESGVVNENTQILCPPTMEVGHRTIHEAHSEGTKLTTVTGVLRDSLNVGTAKIGMMMESKTFYEHIRAFGIGQRTGIDLPSESSGIFRHYKTWYESDRAIIPFGHAVSVTPLQIINAISAISNDGKLMRPLIVKKIASTDDKFVHTYEPQLIRQAVSAKTAAKVREMMREVVVHGTGTSADIPGYSVFGKTGTAWKIDPATGRYKSGAYVASFIGGLPKTTPRVVLAVIIDEPRTTIWGSTAAAPIFKDIMTKVVNYLDIPPDVVSGSVTVNAIAEPASQHQD